MSAKSFRQDRELMPQNYRTPSPPSHLFEPLSPGTTAWSQNWSQPLQRFPASTLQETHTSHVNGSFFKIDSHRSVDIQRHHPHRPRGHVNATLPQQFSTSDSLPAARFSTTGKRPSKRARDEHDGNRSLHTDVAHTTEAIQPSDPRWLEAELLLNFSREASKARTQSMTSVTATRPIDRSLQLNVDHHSASAPVESISPPSAKPNAEAEQNLALHESPGIKQIRAEAHNQAHHQAVFEDDTLTEAGRANVSTSQKQAAELADQAPIINNTSTQESNTEFQNKEVGDNIHATTELERKKGHDKTKEENAPPPPHNETEDQGPSKFMQGIEGAGHAENSLSSPSKDKDAPTKAEEGSQSAKTASAKSKQGDAPSICAACNFSRNVLTAETENDATSWICCDGCKSWFHFACAGFKSEREVRAVDKYRCKKCKPIHGPTTLVRKSARAHSAIDYAGLNEGIVKTSDENPEHHYIKPIKEGTIKFDPEHFARMRPELVTADYFEKGDGMKEPIVIPAEWNPRPRHIPEGSTDTTKSHAEDGQEEDMGRLHDMSVLDEWLSKDYEYEQVSDVGQDSLGMVIPLDLTVRKVSEMYGPEERIEVIDVKSQNGEDKKWNMRRWVDYYEAQGSKPVRNVISLEVSQSKLGRLIRRPQVVRDLDLQDQNWPSELILKGEFPKVQFYCLMSVADCFTDFHIDFGGSSVYYHILKGKKTFFFIPPHEKHLKKYEEWCNSPAQNWTFLGDQTKECYRVDLSEGDTMLIPAGWIHAVWTPEDSLVIGGNFLTRMHYAMQIRVTQIEKATHVARKFRYPAFQKVMYYTAMRYLERDPLPDSVRETLGQGQQFDRPFPSYLDFDGHGEDSAEGIENYHARYYSKAELDGLPELGRYLHRTAMIAAGYITDGITADLRNAIKRSIPKVCGDPFELTKKFAMWYTWKRGNEVIPHWAYPDWVPETNGVEIADKKLSAKALKKLDREAALQAWRVAPDRQSTRQRTQPQNFLAEMVNGQSPSNQSTKNNSPAPTPTTNTLPEVPSLPNPTSPAAPSTIEMAGNEFNEPATLKRKIDITPSKLNDEAGANHAIKKPRTSSGTKSNAARRPACEACRKGRRACKHRDEPLPPASTANSIEGFGSQDIATTSSRPSLSLSVAATSPVVEHAVALNNSVETQIANHIQHNADPVRPVSQASQYAPDIHIGKMVMATHSGEVSGTPSKSSGRSKACKDCRKSKRRCVHDEFGNEDPAKLEQAVIPRPAAKKKRPSGEGVEQTQPKKTKKTSVNHIEPFGHSSPSAYYTQNQYDEPSYVDEPEVNGIHSAIDPRLNDQAMIDPQLQAHSMIDPQLEAQSVIDPQLEPAPAIDPQLKTNSAIDPQLEAMSTDVPMPDAHTPALDEQTSRMQEQAPHPPSSAYNPDDEVNLIATSPFSDVKNEHHIEHEQLGSGSETTHPVTSSLVSPPESTHTDAEETPPAGNKARGITPPVTVGSSRQSSHPIKTAQRYTPESGSVRRASYSSTNQAIARESASPAAQTPHRARTKSRVNSEDEVDEESRRLIQELQAQDMGLRRRGKV